MWLFAMFDLPTKTKTERKIYTNFRKALLKEGFSMMQYSVYARYFPSEDAGKIEMRGIRAILPPEGEVRLVMITDRQFGKMQVFYGKKRKKTEQKPQQLMLF